MEKQFIYGQEQVDQYQQLIKEQHFYVNPFIFIVDGKVVLVGECQVEDGEVHIEHVQSLERSQGYGRLLIEHLIQDLDFKEVWGESVVDAFHFWRKVGAVFEEASEKYFLEHEKEEGFEFEEDFLVPFSIYNPKNESAEA